MDSVLAWGLDVIRVAQSAASPAVTLVMKALSFCGTEYFYVALGTGLYWCVDRRRGARLTVLMLVSTAISLWLKVATAEPRPFDLDPSVGLAFEPTYSFPSNHALNAAVFWGIAAFMARGPRRIVLAVVPPFLIGLSRVYLGVHYPTDVLAGWAIGALIVAAERLAGDRVERALAGQRNSLRSAAAAAVALAMIVLYRQDVSMAGALFGFAAGIVYLPSAAAFSVGGTPAARSLRYIVGMATLVIVYALPKMLVMGLEASGPPLVRFLRYALVGAWAGVGAPWLFMRMRLAAREEGTGSEPGAGPHSA